VNIQALVFLVQGLGVCAAVGMAFVWLAHVLLPDLPPDPALAKQAPPPAQKPSASEATRNALRSMMIVLPLALLFLFASASPSYTVVMIKVASMGQQASSDKSKAMGTELLLSTLWGGLGAIVGWYLLVMWPSLVFYTLLIALAGLIYGRWIFQGPAVHPRFSMATYAFLTMIVVLAPAVLDSPVSSDAESAFYSRLLLFVAIAVYGTLSVKVFDDFWPPRQPSALAPSPKGSTPEAQSA
jgi:hypothetical protein